MSAIVENMKSLWNMYSGNAVKAVKREFDELEKDWADAEAFWMEHPEECFEPFITNF